MKKIRIVEFPIQLFPKTQIALVEQLNIEPDFQPSVVSINLDEISSIHRSANGTVLTLKNGYEWFTTMQYDDVMVTYINIMRTEFDVQMFKYTDNKMAETLN